MAGNWSRISPFKGLDIPLWSGCHCFQWSLLKAHKIKKWKTKREEFTWGRVPLSSYDYHVILRSSFLIQELIRAVFTMHFQVLKCSGESQGKDREKIHAGLGRHDGGACCRVPAMGTHFPGQVLLLPWRKRARWGNVKSEEREQAASVRKVSFKPNLKFVMGMFNTVGWRFWWDRNSSKHSRCYLVLQPAVMEPFHRYLVRVY